MTTLLLAAALLAGAVHEEARYVMGTVAVVRARAGDAQAAEACVDTAFGELSRLENMLSTWREDTALRGLTRAVPGAWSPVPRELAEVVGHALTLAEASGGAFDPTVLPLVRLWGLRGGVMRVPTPAALDSVRQLVGWQAVRAEEERILLARAGIELDLGGIAKGYALDRAAAVMRTAGALAGVLDLGGNLVVFGAQPTDSVAVVAPDDPSRVVARIAVRDAERFVELEGRRYGHILDPRTGQPVERAGSVTVVAPSGWLADGLSTALFVLGEREGLELVAEFPGVRVLWHGVAAPPDTLDFPVQTGR
jgi:thiamine biosynthesis lipoprotein